MQTERGRLLPRKEYCWVCHSVVALKDYTVARLAAERGLGAAVSRQAGVNLLRVCSRSSCINKTVEALKETYPLEKRRGRSV
jgi:hypothetical protein